LHGEVEAVAVEFTGAVAHLVRERRFHHTQRLTDLDGGGVRLEMQVAGLPEVAAWVAGFGGAARPLAPPALVEAVRRLHEEGLRAVAEGPPPPAGRARRRGVPGED
jgi:predicted DNA-binding transcriptional regulator YafY